MFRSVPLRISQPRRLLVTVVCFCLGWFIGSPNTHASTKQQILTRVTITHHGEQDGLLTQASSTRTVRISNTGQVVLTKRALGAASSLTGDSTSSLPTTVLGTRMHALTAAAGQPVLGHGLRPQHRHSPALHHVKAVQPASSRLVCRPCLVKLLCCLARCLHNTRCGPTSTQPTVLQPNLSGTVPPLGE
jgi:hypothetical protein